MNSGQGVHPVRQAIAAVRAAVDSTVDASLWSLPDTEIADLLGEIAREEARLAALRLRVVGEVHGRDLAGRCGAPSTQVWLRSHLPVTPGEAAGQVRLAAALPRFPVLAEAMTEGRLCPGRAREVVRAIDELPPDADREVRERAERILVEHAEVLDRRQVITAGQRILHHVDSDAADAHHGRVLAEQEKQARQRRDLRFTADGHGTVWLQGRLDTESAAVVRRALDPLAAPRPADDGGRDRRSAGARCADALVELCRRALIVGGLPAQGGQRPQVVVTVDYDQLRTGVGAGRLDTGEELSPGAVRRLACDAQILPAVLGSDSIALDLGRGCGSTPRGSAGR